MQRLFTTFANGWPGSGLLIQRLITGIALLYCGIVLLNGSHGGTLMALQIVGAILGLFILAGLWTPVAGALVAAVELWIALAACAHVGISVMLAALGGTLAMIGPGAWSIDARLFGRKQLGS